MLRLYYFRMAFMVLAFPAVPLAFFFFPKYAKWAALIALIGFVIMSNFRIPQNVPDWEEKWMAAVERGYRILSAFTDKLADARDHHVRDIADIQGLMEGGTPIDEPQDVVSQDEYRFLFEAGRDSEAE